MKSPVPTTPPKPTSVNSWSYSRLADYETCPYRIKLKVIDKIPEPPRDPETDPLARGDRIHKALEDAVRDGAEVPPEVKKHADLVRLLHSMHQDGMVRIEEPWNFDSSWQRTKEWEKIWLRVKLDVAVVAKDTVVVIDYKTGKSFMKDIPHTQQTQLYAGTAALLFPQAKTIITEIWYTDEGGTRRIDYKRDVALDFLPRFERRANVMLNDRIFRPRPNVVNCKWCPYSPRGNGACPFGV